MPAPASEQVQIIDTETQHIARVLGDSPCDIDFTVTDYGGVGYVTGVEPACAFQPQNSQFASGQFSPHEITITWSGACAVTDTWELSR
jgi:hypothetical protein